MKTNKNLRKEEKKKKKRGKNLQKPTVANVT